MKLSITQIALGVLIIGLLVWYIGWVEPETGVYYQDIEGAQVELVPVSGWVSGVVVWKAVSFLLGLAIITCGFIQYKQARD
jgi:hypothetical protein